MSRIGKMPIEVPQGVDATLSVMRVEARFSDPVTYVAARSRDAGKFLLDVRDCGEDRPLSTRSRRILLPDARA